MEQISKLQGISSGRPTSPRVMFLIVAKIAIMPVSCDLERGPGLLTVALFLNCGRPHLGYVEVQPQRIVSIAVVGHLSSGSGFQNLDWSCELTCVKKRYVAGLGRVQSCCEVVSFHRPALKIVEAERVNAFLFFLKFYYSNFTNSKIQKKAVRSIHRSRTGKILGLIPALFFLSLPRYQLLPHLQLHSFCR
jgi:hypothetical protein